MGQRKTGEFTKPREITVHTCDQCGSDIEMVSGQLRYPNYEIMIRTWEGSEDSSGMTCYSLCSLPCVKKMADRLAAGERVPKSDCD